LDGFGGEIEKNDGEKTSLKALVEESESGVVVFTYPRASTPGCKFLSLFCSLSFRVIGRICSSCFGLCFRTSVAFLLVYPWISFYKESYFAYIP
jgi:hypothetical protein